MAVLKAGRQVVGPSIHRSHEGSAEAQWPCALRVYRRSRGERAREEVPADGRGCEASVEWGHLVRGVCRLREAVKWWTRPLTPFWQS